MPRHLRLLELGAHFDQPIDAVAWSSPLEQLRFGLFLNQPVNRVLWPTSLRELGFGSGIYQSQDCIVRPATSTRLVASPNQVAAEEGNGDCYDAWLKRERILLQRGGRVG